MSVEIKVPNLPESVSDATVAKWHKKPGDAVSRDEILVDLETDKVVLEVPAPADGVLKEISAEEGETVTEGQALGMLEEGEAPSSPEPDDKQDDKKDDKDGDKDTQGRENGKSRDSQPKAEPTRSDDKDLSPSVRRVVRENDVDPSEVEASGRGGRL
ncbi:MAG: biotin/lipoyl-containing protein, partial [Wenzhouxiangella sp.]